MKSRDLITESFILKLISMVIITALFSIACESAPIRKTKPSTGKTTKTAGTVEVKKETGLPSTDTVAPKTMAYYDLPELSIRPVTGTALADAIDGTSASVTGSIRADGASAIKEAGFCWATHNRPTMKDPHGTVSDRPVFSFSITSLKPATVYYVRSYAVNDHGIGYSEPISFNSGYPLGSTHAGGIVFWNDGLGGGMVIAAKNTPMTAWITGGATQKTANGKTRVTFGTAQANTDAIIAQPGHNSSAAKLCREARFEGYSDWSLPSEGDMLHIIFKLYRTGRIDLKGQKLWTSTEKDATWAYAAFFDTPNGSTAPQPKTWERFECRPVRRFAP